MSASAGAEGSPPPKRSEAAAPEGAAGDGDAGGDAEHSSAPASSPLSDSGSGGVDGSSPAHTSPRASRSPLRAKAALRRAVSPISSPRDPDRSGEHAPRGSPSSGDDAPRAPIIPSDLRDRLAALFRKAKFSEELTNKFVDKLMARDPREIRGFLENPQKMLSYFNSMLRASTPREGDPQEGGELGGDPPPPPPSGSAGGEDRWADRAGPAPVGRSVSDSSGGVIVRRGGARPDRPRSANAEEPAARPPRAGRRGDRRRQSREAEWLSDDGEENVGGGFGVAGGAGGARRGSRRDREVKREWERKAGSDRDERKEREQDRRDGFAARPVGANRKRAPAPPASGGGADDEPQISVVVRSRPMSRSELARKQSRVLEKVSRKTVVIHEPKVKVDLTRYTEQHEFTFDEVFGSDTSTEHIYNRTARPLVSSVFEGRNATCFAYGQTGSGKTFTMMGTSDGRQPGIYTLAARDIFSMMRGSAYSHLRVHVSFYEIYGGRLFDLLNDRKVLRPLVDGNQAVNIVGLLEQRVSDMHELFRIIDYGLSVRSTGSTGANLDSSRSHAVLQIALMKKIPATQRGKKAKMAVHGKFSFIDLAGSERGADTTHADRQTRLEGAEINKSLLALKECIRSLYQESIHTPFRGSKLTQVLKDSFTGNARTVMIATVSPNSGNCEHTLNTLRYAYRVKEIRREEGLEDEESDEAVDSVPMGVTRRAVSAPSGAQRRRSGGEPSGPRRNRRSRGRSPDGAVSGDDTEGSTDSLEYSDDAANRRRRRSRGTASAATAASDAATAGTATGGTRADAPQSDAPGGAKPERVGHLAGGGADSVADSGSAEANDGAGGPEEESAGSSGDETAAAVAPSAAQSETGQAAASEAEKPSGADGNSAGTGAPGARDGGVDDEAAPADEQAASPGLDPELVAAHRTQIQEMMDLVKSEMRLVSDRDRSAVGTIDYIQQMDELLSHKLEIIVQLRAQLAAVRDDIRAGAV